MPNFQNNFATNLTSATSATDTTSPLNSIPTVDAPFYIAFDATNINSHYEVQLCTSKTATNVNHAALAYDHTAAEEVRLIVPAAHYLATQNAPRGFLMNGKIAVTDAAGITVAIKTLAGNDPSVSDPVYCRIGDSIRTITAALSVVKADGTNWFNAGSAILATKEIDYFVYLGYNATDGVVIGFSRIVGEEYDSFSATTTNEKYCAISTITNSAAGDDYEVIGRFAATLSAGAGYTWTVPTFTNKNLIQRPVYETRWLGWTPGWAGYSANPAPVASYRVLKDRLNIDWKFGSLGTSSDGNNIFTLPFITNAYTIGFRVMGQDNSAPIPAILDVRNSSDVYVRKESTPSTDGNWTASGTKGVYDFVAILAF